MSEIIIPLHGLTRGGQEFDFVLDSTFLDAFSHDVVGALDCKVHFVAEQKGGWIEIRCRANGCATVECDRCLEDLVLPVDIDELFTIRFDADPQDVVEEDDNTIILREGTAEMDFAQTLYDLVCVGLPMTRVHPEGGCNPEVIARLSREDTAAKESGNTPFSGLKDLLKQSEEK